MEELKELVNVNCTDQITEHERVLALLTEREPDRSSKAAAAQTGKPHPADKIRYI